MSRPIHVEAFHPAQLSASDILAWRALCASRPGLDSPLLGPDFARAVGAVRTDARVAVWRQDDEAVGFLAYHHRPGGYARPIGAPLSDYHGPVSSRPLDVAAGLAQVGIHAYRFSGLVDPDGLLADAYAGQASAWVIELDQSAEDYLEALRARSPKRFKNLRRLSSKITRELGPLRLSAPETDPQAFHALLRWKQEQIARTGVHDFLAPSWTRALLENFMSSPTGELQGLMICLYAGDRLLAGQMGVRVGAVFHPWIASVDPQMSEWSPGHLFLLQAIGAMPSLGLETYDLGASHDHYKKPYALGARTIHSGTLASGGARGAGERLWTLCGAQGSGPVGRLRRRLDVICASELTLSGRARGLADAFARRSLRAGAPTAQEAGEPS